MSNLKRVATSPPSKENKKTKEEDCVVCLEPATDDVLECIWCDGRVHAKCVKISEEQSSVLGNVTNIVFFCNVCLHTLPTALKYYDDLSPMDSRITNVEKSIAEIQSTGNQLNTVSKEVEQFSKQHHEVADQISNLTARINQLVSHNNQIKTQIEDINVAIHKKSNEQTAQQSGSAPSQTITTGTTLTILEELADRERRRKNLIIYNMPEPTDGQSDQQSFKDLCSAAFSANVNLSKTARLGRKFDNKHRPLLVCIDDASVRDSILYQSGKLRKHDQFKNVYIAPDRTKFEREKHQKLVAELKQRRSNGEQNLVIRNGSIVVFSRHPQRAAGPASDQSSNHS